MVRARIESVERRRPDLRRPFPRRFVERLTAQTVVAVRRRAKYLLVSLSSGETLLIHLGMSGSLRVVRETTGARRRRGDVAPDPHDHVVLHMSSGRAVVFNDPRRFGVMDLIAVGQLDDHPALSGLGPEPLSDDFDAAALARACRGKKTSIKAALLDQRVVAGLGNIYAVEALHMAGISPLRRASTLATRSGAPRETTSRLVDAIKRVLVAAIARQLRGVYGEGEFAVYDRRGEPCLRSGCTGMIRRRAQGGRSTFYCPVCQQ
jgi:formamidopyrimidine-DNA glycosylase